MEDRFKAVVLVGAGIDERVQPTLPEAASFRERRELALLDGVGHHPPAELRAPRINAFLDRVLGPVRLGSRQAGARVGYPAGVPRTGRFVQRRPLCVDSPSTRHPT